MNNNQAGRLIVLEGIDGTGKSTQIGLLAGELKKRGYEVIATREPTDGPVGDRIRALYTHRNSVSKEEELQLFLDDRRDHVRRLINPALERGAVVLTDRYYLSTAAYQGAAGFSVEEIMQKNETFAPAPDLAILIELPPKESVMRIQKYRNETLNDFEQETTLQKVAKMFSLIDRGYIRRLDGLKSVAEVHSEIMGHVDLLLGSTPC